MKVLVHKSKGKWRVYVGNTYTEHDEVYLKDVSFFVIPDFQETIRETQSRVPHAFAFGELTEKQNVASENPEWKAFNYDVFKNDTFTLLTTNEPVTTAQFVWLGPKDNYLL